MASSSEPALYPAVPEGHPDAGTAFIAGDASGSHLYPSVDEVHATARELFPEPSAPPEPAADVAARPIEEPILSLSGAVLHLIDPDHSLDLGAGHVSILRIREGDHEVAVLGRLVPVPPRCGCLSCILGDETPVDPVQWPLTRDIASVKLDEGHYFFSVHVPHTQHEDPSLVADDKADEAAGDAANEIVSYGLTIAGMGQEEKLKEFDALLDQYTSFSVHKVEVPPEAPPEEKAVVLAAESTVKKTTPKEALGPKQEEVNQQSAAYWTTLAPNVESYNSMLARLVARGSGQVIRGILWTGRVTSFNLKKGETVMKRKLRPGKKPPGVSRRAIRRMKRVRWMTTMSEKVAIGILTGVVKVTGFFTSSIAKAKPVQKFFKLMPGEVVIASLDGFGKICDAVEIAGKDVMGTTAVVATNVATHKFGDETGQLTNEYLHATGHALGAAWAVFKIKKALEPEGRLNSTSLAKSTAEAMITKAAKGKLKL